MTCFIFAEWQKRIAVCLGSAIVTAPGLFSVLKVVGFLSKKKNTLTCKKKKNKREEIQDSPITSTQTRLWRWWSYTSPMILLWHPHCVTALTVPHYCLDATQRQGTLPTALCFPASCFLPPFIYRFFVVWRVWLFGFFDSILILLEYWKTGLSWRRAHHAQGCSAKLDTGQRGYIAKLDVPRTPCAKMVTQGKLGL